MESNQGFGNQNFRPHSNHGNRGGGGRGRGRGGGGGHRPHRGRGESKLTRKFNNRANQRNNYNSYNNNVISMQNNLPASIDLTNQALVEHIGEIFYKESFLEDPWNNITNEENQMISEN